MALLTGRQNSKLFGRNDPYGIIDTRQTVGYDKGKESGGNELSLAGQGWAQPNQTRPGTPNAYAEYLAYKEKVQAQQQRLALEQALRELFVQEQAARAVAGQQAVAYNGADGFASGGYETGGTAGADGIGGAGDSGGIDGAYEAGDTFKSSGLDGGAGADSVLSAAGTGEATGQVLSERDSETKFKSKELLDSHYDKYKGEFGNISKDEYLKKANDLINSTGDDVLTKVRDNGDTLYYNEATNEFAVKTKDGFLRTFFKPGDGLEYFNRQ